MGKYLQSQNQLYVSRALMSETATLKNYWTLTCDSPGEADHVPERAVTEDVQI